jgi:hypothetical protein
MAFKPGQVAAMKYKDLEKAGKLPANPMNAQNIATQIPNLFKSNPMPNPLEASTTSLFRPEIPGLPMPKTGTVGPLRRFSKLKHKLRKK